MKTHSVAEAKAHLSARLGNAAVMSQARFDMAALRDFVAHQPLGAVKPGPTVAEMREKDIL